MPDLSNALALTFNGSPVTFRPYGDGHVVIAREMGAALGYSDPVRLPKLIRSEWAEDFTEGTDYELLTGPALASFKDVAGDNEGRHTALVPHAKSLLVLTETGLWAVALRTEKAMGVRLRHFLKSEVLPKLARGESVGGTDPARLREMRHAIRLLPKGDPRFGAMLDEYTTALGHPPIALPVATLPVDGVAAFVESYCKRGKGEVSPAADLYAAYAKQGGLLSPKGFGSTLSRLGFVPRAQNGSVRMWTGLALTNDSHEAKALSWAEGRSFELAELRAATGVVHDNRTIGFWLRRAGYESVRARADFRYFDRWRRVIPD